MDLGILNLEIGQTHAGGHANARVECERDRGIETGPLPIHAVRSCRNCGRLPALVIAGVTQRKPKMVGAGFDRFKTDVESSKTLEQLILVVDETAEKAG